MLTITKRYAIELLDRSANALAGVDDQLSQEIREAIKFSLYAVKAKRASERKERKARRSAEPTVKKYTARQSQFIELVAAGMNRREIGEALGVTRERVRQIANRLGVFPAKSYGTKTRDELQAKREQSNQRSLDHWGYDRDTMKKHRASGWLREYEENRNSALTRGIEWSLNFKQWNEIWEASGCIQFRGRGKGKYVLGRKGAVGPYSADNVEVVTCEENIRRARAKGDKESAYPGVYHLYPRLKKGWVARAKSQFVGHFATPQEAAAARNAFIAQQAA